MSRSEILFWITLGYAMSFLFTLVPEGYAVSEKYILFKKTSMDLNTHMYYLGERFNFICLFYVIYKLASHWLFEVTLYISILYFIDYILFYNDPIVGIGISFAMIKGGTLCLLLILSLTKYSK